MARLTVTAHARADLREIHSYVAKDNPEAARRLIERLRATARALAETPGVGRSREELRPDLFSFPVGRHVLFYRPHPGRIVLVRVVHGARDMVALFGATETWHWRSFHRSEHGYGECRFKGLGGRQPTLAGSPHVWAAELGPQRDPARGNPRPPGFLPRLAMSLEHLHQKSVLQH